MILEFCQWLEHTSLGVAIGDVALQRPTLDDVFLSLTGHATEEEDT